MAWMLFFCVGGMLDETMLDYFGVYAIAIDLTSIETFTGSSHCSWLDDAHYACFFAVALLAVVEQQVTHFY